MNATLRFPSPVFWVPALMALGAASGPPAAAGTWTLIDFGASADANVYGVEGWDQPIVSPLTRHTADGGGGTRLDEAAGGDWTLNYQGVSGAPREFVKGEQIVVTWRNTADHDVWFAPRIGFEDAGAFEWGDADGHWYGMSDWTGNRTRAEIAIPAGGTAVSVYAFNEEPAEGVPSSIGTHSLVNVAVGTGDFYRFLVCDKIELSNEADWTPPAAPEGLRAGAVSDYAIEIAWNAPGGGVDIGHYVAYANGSPYRIVDGPPARLTGLEAGARYELTVSAVDRAGNESAPSAPAVVETLPFQGGDGLIDPQRDLRYLGAFRLPDGEHGASNFYFGGDAAAHYPGGDPDGPDDGHPGSIFLTRFFALAAEISIPAPAIPADGNYESLPEARALQGFHDISGGYPMTDLHWWQGLAYLPAQAGQRSEHLYYCFAEHLYFEETNAPSHCWLGLDLSNPNVRGFWRMGGNLHNYLTSRYLFEIPAGWAAEHAPGMRLVTGRCRDGGQLGAGPSMFAIGPWNQGDPPPDGTELEYATLLRYGDFATDRKADNWLDGDDWTGGAWLEAGTRSAVVFAGTKFTGRSFYGYPNGTVFTDIEFDSSFTEFERGWMASSTKGQMLFYDPRRLAEAAAGGIGAHEPQPYAVLDLDGVLLNHEGTRINEMRRLGSPCYGRESNVLYLFEHRGEQLPAVHAWKVETREAGVPGWSRHN